MNSPDKWPSKECKYSFEIWWQTPGVGCGDEPNVMVIWAFIEAWKTGREMIKKDPKFLEKDKDE